MGGTFNRNSFEQELTLADDEFIPCVTPIGYARSNPRIFDKALRYVVKADNKKSWDQLFFKEDFNHSLSEDVAGLLATPIEMVRLGPSASNKQPWRLVLSQNGRDCHFYIEHTPNYSAKLGYDMQLLDMGIAMCQFELSCQELKLSGQWVKEEPDINLPNENYEYIITWIGKNE
jgi:cytochrome oxidase assembly protein ShyY1